MDNNKNRMKDRPKNNTELRKIDPKGNANLGIKNGVKIGAYENSKNPHKTYEWLN